MKDKDPAGIVPVIDRREVLVTGSLAVVAGLLGPAATAFAATPESAPPAKGDRLILDTKGADKGKPVLLESVPIDGPLVQALPADAASGTVRSKSRFNKLVLIRLAPEKLDEETRKHAAEGVVAYSAICTHQNCAVSGWNKDKQALACFCHGSFFSAGEGGKVVGGPAKRRLPILPVAVGPDGALIVAGAFTAKPGTKS